MAWDSDYVNFGVVRIDGNKVHIHRDKHNHDTLSVGEPVTNANWAGGELNVSLANGKVRRYSSKHNFNTIG